MAVETILVAVGPQDYERVERLAEETVDIAGPTGAEVVLAHAFTREGYEKARTNLYFDDATPDEVAERNATIRDLEDVLEETDIDYTIRGAVGDPGDTMVELAGSCDADIVVVGGRERSPAGKALFGSVAQSIMLDAPCPTLYVRTGTE
ncbi:universal stress protein [Haloplanus aerogenes]|uniref:Nucleotide-binding universal stress UspA family protein n=1 Tax=Haloplanus aerogenes TaxID=660522 RepID=A0A3M0CU77_9EURY|nr:universal stress protein [Haloplanus aerogenes]AZH26894.1 universal stress protein [Haloplanus aerogenes]RMB12545.1 nucleotide-binding universal stress UspA family protein [Haloplanus aerogenes]